MYFILFFLTTFNFASEKIFVACEGNFYQNNGTLWTISEDESISYSNNPIGEIVQSVYVNENELYVISNGSSTIQVYDITSEDLVLTHIIDTEYSGPREMIVYNESLYFTNWYTADIKKLNLSTWEIDSEISMPGLPEDIVFHDGLLYVSIAMEFDWTDGNEIVVINPDIDEVVEIYEVGLGPGDLTVHDGSVFVARTFYDENWNAFYGTSKISSSGDVIMANYGAGIACGGSVHSYQGDIYRAFNGGIAKLNEDLDIITESRIGDYLPSDVYSVAVINENIYFGLADFQDPDEVAVVNSQGNEIARYSVGVAPGDFASWDSCLSDGDVNEDNLFNITDIVIAVYGILNDSSYLCSADVNSDNIVNILDVIQMVQDILGIESFDGAANWVMKHFPQLKTNERIKQAMNTPTLNQEK